jgi:outer membrane biosynthesis protein TonB
VVGALVDPDGAVSSTKLLKSAGYDLLNQAALNEAQSYNFGATGKYQAFSIGVSFDPSSACSGSS